MNKIAILTGLLLIGGLAACSSEPTPAPVTHYSQGTSDIKDVQTKLTQQGYYHGKIDGVWGPLTENAVYGYQQMNNLEITGKLNPETLASLHDTP